MIGVQNGHASVVSALLEAKALLEKKNRVNIDIDFHFLLHTGIGRSGAVLYRKLFSFLHVSIRPYRIYTSEWCISVSGIRTLRLRCITDSSNVRIDVVVCINVVSVLI